MRVLKKSYLLLFSLVLALNFGVSSNHFAEESSNNYKEIVYIDGIFYVKEKPANGWYIYEKIIYYFKDGKKFTGHIQIGKRYKYVVNGLYAYGYANGIFYDYGSPYNGWKYDGIKEFYFKEGKKFTGTIKEDDGEKYIINGEYAKGYIEGLFYSNGKLGDWWYDDGTAWYFFRDGKKFTGKAVDGNGKRYFVNGKYANGVYEGKFYKDGVETSGNIYVNDVFYDKDGKPANGWHKHEDITFYFKEGKKFTGFIQIGKINKYIVNGRYAYGYANDIFYAYGVPVNGWQFDGIKKFYFKEGKKFTGTIKEDDEEKYIINGEYTRGYIRGLFYSDGKIANWWVNDGTAWYFFQDGKKFTGLGVDGNGERYFVNGKYANGDYEGKFYKDGVETTGKTYINDVFYVNGKVASGWFDDGTAWYFFKDGKKLTGKAVDGNGEMQFFNGKYANRYIDNIYYKDGKIANWWCDDGTAWYFFQDGKKFTGLGVDGNGERYFVNGKYANGIYNDKLYKDGVETTDKIYINDIFYVNGKLANWWYDDGTAWYFFKDGKKLTGKAVDGNGEMYFSNGKYANTYVDGIFCYEGKPTNGWFDDGTAWYFFKGGKKYTGLGVDGNGKMYFSNGKYANTYVDGIFCYEGKQTNGWFDDGNAWYFFKDGKKFTGHGVDGNGERYFVEGKYANGFYEGKLYKDGVEAKGKVYVNGIFYDEKNLPANGWYDDGNEWFFFRNGKKFTGKAVDGNGEMDFVNGKYKRNNKVYSASEEVQKRIVEAAHNTSSPGPNLCARWVSTVYRNAGLGYIGGNANDMYRKHTFTSDIADLKLGMLVAVESSSSGSRMGKIYGHVGIYIGDGKVMDSVGYKKISTLEEWIKTYCKHSPVGFGYPPSVEEK